MFRKLFLKNIHFFERKKFMFAFTQTNKRLDEQSFHVIATL